MFAVITVQVVWSVLLSILYPIVSLPAGRVQLKLICVALLADALSNEVGVGIVVTVNTFPVLDSPNVFEAYALK